MCSCMIKTSLFLPWKSSVIFGNLQEFSESVQKIIKKDFISIITGYNTWLLVDMEFLFSCTTWYLTIEQSEKVTYQVEHFKRNSFSACTHVLFFWWVAQSPCQFGGGRKTFANLLKKIHGFWSALPVELCYRM